MIWALAVVVVVVAAFVLPTSLVLIIAGICGFTAVVASHYSNRPPL